MKKFSSIILFIAACCVLNAQIDKDFWFAIPKETDTHLWCSLTSNNAAQFRIVAMSRDARVTISMPANANFIPVVLNIPANSTFNYSFTPNAAPNYKANWVLFDSVYANPANYDLQPFNGTTNHGIHITSSNDISVYYDYDNYWNRELFSLKGKNALGTTFFMPFQNIWKNDNRSTATGGISCYQTGTGNSGHTAKFMDAFSEFDIVATQNGTLINIYDANNNLLVANVPLKAGQTYSYVAPAQTAAAHMTGYKVVSNLDVAVTINDDSVNVTGTAGADVIGDQIVPTNIIGSKYLVMVGDDGTAAGGGKINSARNEQIFVVATEPNTHIQFRDTAGVILTDTTINSGRHSFISPNRLLGTQSSIYVESLDPSKPIYVLHISGHGCETGGALLPPINNCNGSSDVSVVPGIAGTFADGSDSKITMNLMVPYDPSIAFNDPAQAHNHFILYNSTYPGGYAVPGTWFEPNRNCNWAVLRMANRNWGPTGAGGNNLMVFNAANRIENKARFFHLGMMNGDYDVTNKYGYFSSFNEAQSAVTIAGVETQDFIGCFGSTATLVASGGLKYLWHYGSPSGPPTYISNQTSATTDAIGLPVGDHQFYVEVINPKCFGRDTLKVKVTILSVAKALFEVDKPVICGNDTIKLTNLSQIATMYKWDKQVDNGLIQLISREKDFKELLENTTSVPKVIRYRLMASNNAGCNDTISKIVTVYPQVKASFSADPILACSPVEVHFTNQSSSNAVYTWDFGDQWASDLSNPTHKFYNNGTKDTIYKIRLVVKSGSPYFCTDTMTGIVNVLPQVKALFNINTPVICAGSEVKFTNLSQNATINMWTKQANNEQPETFVPANLNFTETPANTTSVRKVIKYRLTASSNQGCNDTISHSIMVFPQVVAKFSTDVNTGDSPLKVQFTNLSTSNTMNAWDFGDQISDDLTNPEHIFCNNSSKDTSYRTRLKAKSSDGCSDTISQTITVHANSQVLPKIISTVKPSFSETAVKVYPNPAQDAINIEYNLTQSSVVLIELLDPTGKLLNKIMESRPSGDNMSKLHIGLYQTKFLIIKISFNGKSIEFKVIKE
jgi:PKD repeat protein